MMMMQRYAEVRLYVMSADKRNRELGKSIWNGERDDRWRERLGKDRTRQRERRGI